MTGNLALDYVATVAERVTTHYEHLTAPEALAGWIAQAGIVDGRVEVTLAGLERAKALREALFALVAARDRRAAGSARGALRRERGGRGPAADGWPQRRRPAPGGRPRRGPLRPRPHRARAARRPRAGSPQVVRRRALHAPVRRPLPRWPAALVRDGRLRRPREGRGLPRAAARALVGRAVEDDRPLPEVSRRHGRAGSGSAPASRAAGRSASPRQLQECSAQRELPDQARATPLRPRCSRR